MKIQYKKKKSLGNMERQLFAYAQMRGTNTLKTGDLTRALNLSNLQERKLYSRLSKAGMIGRLRRGLYLVPLRLPLGGRWTPDEILALNTLMKDKGGKYQISGPNAFNRYGFDEQIPTRLYAYNNVISGERTIGSLSFVLIKVATLRLGDVEEAKGPDGEMAFYSTRCRALFDAIYDWSRFNTLPRAYDWLQKELHEGRVTAMEIATVALKYGDISTIRRIGYMLEWLEAKGNVLAPLRKAIKRTSATIPLIPNRPKRGRFNSVWGIVDNRNANNANSRNSSR